MKDLIQKYKWYGLILIAILLMFVSHNNDYSYSDFFSFFCSVIFSAFVLERKNTVVFKVELFFIVLLILFFWLTLTCFFADQYLISSVMRSFLVFFPLLYLYITLNKFNYLKHILIYFHTSWLGKKYA